MNNKKPKSPNSSNKDEKKDQLLKLTQGFCRKYLDKEYEALSEKVILKLARKRSVPFLAGRLEIWAAAIIHALGHANFLFDRSFEPYVDADTLSQHFNTSKSTVSAKSRLIRNMLKIDYFNAEFATAFTLKNNPLHNLVIINGLPLPIEILPPDLQKFIRENDISGLEIDLDRLAGRTPTPDAAEMASSKNLSRKGKSRHKP